MEWNNFKIPKEIIKIWFYHDNFNNNCEACLSFFKSLSSQSPPSQWHPQRSHPFDKRSFLSFKSTWSSKSTKRSIESSWSCLSSNNFKCMEEPVFVYTVNWLSNHLVPPTPWKINEIKKKSRHKLWGSSCSTLQLGQAYAQIQDQGMKSWMSKSEHVSLTSIHPKIQDWGMKSPKFKSSSTKGSSNSSPLAKRERQ